MVAYLNTATTGVLQRGWMVRAMANIGSAPTFMPLVTAHRAALRRPQFPTDTASQKSRTLAGRVSVVATDLISHAGAQRFIDDTAAGNTAYYADDSTHLNVLAMRSRDTGGDTPQYGVAAWL